MMSVMESYEFGINHMEFNMNKPSSGVHSQALVVKMESRNSDDTSN